MTIAPGDLIPMPTLANLRDVGGWPIGDGRTVRTGLLYRSTDLSHLSGDDLVPFAALGIRTVVDMRTEDERTAQPDAVPPGAELIIADVLADSTQAVPAQLLALLTDPKAAQQMLGDGKAVAIFEKGYREIVSLPSALTAYRLFFTELARESRRPLLFHCTTGKDRTGWAAAATLLLLGVSREDVRADYQFTNRDLLPALAPVFDRFAAAGGDPELLRPVLGVDARYLAAAMDEMSNRFGSIEGYFNDGLGIDRAGRNALRSALLD